MFKVIGKFHHKKKCFRFGAESSALAIILIFGKGNRGPEPGAQVLEPLHLTRILGPPPDVYLHSLLSFFVFLCLSVCIALKLRPLPFTHPVYVAPRSFQ